MKGWDQIQLSEICEFGNGLWTGKKGPFKEVDVIRNTNFSKEGKLDFSDIARLKVEERKYVKRKLQYGDIIVEKSGGGPKQPVGRVAIFERTDGEFSFSNFTSSIRIKDKKQLDFRYLHTYLHFQYVYGVTESMQSHSTGIRNLKFDDYKQIKVPFPTLHEQRRIVSILDSAFAAIAKAIANAEKNLQNAKELFASYLQGVFANAGGDWEEKTINEIAENWDSKRVPITKSARKSGKYPYYGASGIVDYVADYIFDDDLLLISEDGANLLARTYPIAFSASGKAWVNNHAHVLHFKSKDSHRFVEYYLNSIKLDDYVSGMAQPKLNQKMLNSIPIPFAPIETQRLINAKLDSLSDQSEKLESIYEQKLNYLEELKKSILQKAFSGELKIKQTLAV